MGICTYSHMGDMGRCAITSLLNQQGHFDVSDDGVTSRGSGTVLCNCEQGFMQYSSISIRHNFVRNSRNRTKLGTLGDK
jgi:hypothetical protein